MSYITISQEITDLDEYNIISAHYGDNTTSHGVPLMQHINEGIIYLEKMNATPAMIKAWCIHPIVQKDINIDVSFSEGYSLAIEYALRANSYLCTPNTDYITNARVLQSIMTPMSSECIKLLITDKVQNYSDLLIYNRDHPRAEKLERYFSIWLQYLRNTLTERT